MQLFQRVVTSRDVELKFVPRIGQESLVKIRSKSVDENKIFTMYIRDIELTDISGSINIQF
jgi:hypothetical protein